MRSSHLFFVAVLVAASATPVLAGKSKQVRYVGVHPIAAAHGGGFCEIEAPHVHIFAANKLEYRTHGPDHFFVGDPVAYGYHGPRTAYKGHHPIHVHAVVGDDDDDVEYCYLDGPHFHAFEPAVKADFELAGDAYFYVGDPEPVYLEARPALVKVNAVYAPLRYERPVVTVEAPSAWIGVRAGFFTPVAEVDVRGPVVVAPRLRAEVIVPAPSVEVNIGFGAGVFVDGPGRKRGHYKHKHKGKRGRW
jgi:hypothetical protein